MVEPWKSLIPRATSGGACCVADGKPNSVYVTNHICDHFSRPAITHRLKRPTRLLSRTTVMHKASQTAWSCTRRSLPCHDCHQPCGALLPHLFNLTCTDKSAIGGLFSVALVLTCRGKLVGVTHRRVLPCSDFPLNDQVTQRPLHPQRITPPRK